MAEDKVLVFTAPGCAPCQDLKDALRDGNVEVEGVDVAPDQIEVVDVSNDDGYPYLDKYSVSRVPAAYYKGQQCQILVDDATHKVTVSCPSTNGAEPEEELHAD